MDTDMTDVPDADIPHDASDDTADDMALPLSEKERTILELYDRLLEVEVELALYRARQALSIDENAVISQEDLKQAQQRLLEARASWTLRNDVVSSVMTVNPIIKSVHSGTEASPIERDLLPHLQSRDEISSTLAKRYKQQQEIKEELSRTQVEAIQTSRRNVELAATVLELAERAKKEEDVADEETKEEMERLEKEVKMSRQRWKVIKGTASAVVAGSGVDWVGDDELRELVLDGD